MTNFVKLPNLPDGKVTVAAIGEKYSVALEKALEQYGVRVRRCPKNPYIDPRLSSHIDLSLFHIGENQFLLSKHAAESAFAEELRQLGAEIIVSKANFGKSYPNDAFLCALLIGGKIFHNENLCDSRIINLFGKSLFSVKQGYAKCAVCPVSENAAISADKGLITAMRREDIEVLEISPGFISLEGFDRGFIGGSALKLSSDIMAFTGTLEKHPDKQKIEEFLKRHGISPVYLTERPVFDAGSIIPFCEEGAKDK